MSDDVQLLQAWRNGDESAGNELLRRHFDGLFRFFRARFDDGVADLVQRTFLAAVEARDRMPTPYFRAYLFGIAHNLLLMELRRLSRQRVVPGSPYEAAASSGGSPSKAVLRHEEQRLIVKALRSLPVDLQVTVQLYYWEGFAVADIGEIVGIPAGTVKSRLHRARDLIKKAVTSTRFIDPAITASTLTGLEKWARSVRNAFDPHPSTSTANQP